MGRVPVSTDYLAEILARKRIEIARRARHRVPRGPEDRAAASQRVLETVAVLRRHAGAPRVIAEIKLQSPSAGRLRDREVGGIARLAREYVGGGATAVSVLCDGAGFGGTPLDVRRVVRAVPVPVLFKEFVLDPLQVSLAHALGARMVLLLVRALSPDALHALVDATLELGMVPVVEAADLREVQVALATRAPLVGVNARDLRTFRVDSEAALGVVEAVPTDRVAVHMSGITSADDLARVARGRADAVLIGEALIRAPSPGIRLREWLGALPPNPRASLR